MSSSYQNEGELELGLGLSLHTGSSCTNNNTQWGASEHVKKIRTAKDFPSATKTSLPDAHYSASPPNVRYIFCMHLSSCVYQCICWESVFLCSCFLLVFMLHVLSCFIF